jgi:FMN-dependent NADH-azoreductase
VIDRDLATSLLPHLDEVMMGAFFTPENRRSSAQKNIGRLSGTLVA